LITLPCLLLLLKLCIPAAISQDNFVWNESGSDSDGTAVNGGWSQWADWDDKCQSKGVKTRVRECTSPSPKHGGQACSDVEELACKTEGVPKSLTAAKMAKCQFAVVEKYAVGVDVQGRHFEECVNNIACLGVYKNMQTGVWRKFLFPLPLNRLFYEENCNSASPRTTMNLYIHRERMASYFSCDKNKFSVPGVPGSKTYYLYEHTKLAREDARANCHKYGGKLLEVESQTEHQVLQGFVSRTEYSWTGHVNMIGADSKVRNNWVGEYSGTAVGQNADWLWNNGEPNGDANPGAHFVVDWKLNDLLGTTPMESVCECQDPLVTYLEDPLVPAKMAKCQFAVLDNYSEDIDVPGQQFIECASNSACLGVYKNLETGLWRQLFPPQPFNRRFYEEKCQLGSDMTTVDLYLHRERMNSFTCDRSKFSVSGLPASKTYYRYERTKLSRADAADNCRKYGGKLVEIESPTEHEVLQGFTSRSEYTWTGHVVKSGADSKVRENWIGEYSGAAVGQNADYLWNNGEPNGDLPNPGAHFAINWKFNDAAGSLQMNSLCECQDPLVTYIV
jgi:hypothetical protein